MTNRQENREKYNSFLLYTQKKDIKNIFVSDDNDRTSPQTYYLTNKKWLRDYRKKFNFEESLKKIDNYLLYIPYEEVKKQLNYLDDNGTPFNSLDYNYLDYEKQEDFIQKENYNIYIPKNIELISEDYIKDCMDDNNFGFDKIKLYIGSETMLIIKEENPNHIFICDLDNTNELFDFNIKINGVIILETLNLCDILEQLKYSSIITFLENNNIDKDTDDIQEIKIGRKIAKYLNYFNNNENNISNEENNNSDENNIENNNENNNGDENNMEGNNENNNEDINNINNINIDDTNKENKDVINDENENAINNDNNDNNINNDYEDDDILKDEEDNKKINENDNINENSNIFKDNKNNIKIIEETDNNDENGVNVFSENEKKINFKK